jgi:hypothetical protein
MTSNLSDRINALSDLRVVPFLQYFNQSLLDGIEGDLELLFENIPPTIREIPEFSRVERLSLEEEEIQLDEEQSVTVSRQILQALAQNPRFSSLLQRALDTYADREGSVAKNIVAVGLAASMIVTSSTAKSFEVNARGVKIKVEHQYPTPEVVELVKEILKPLANLPGK